MKKISRALILIVTLLCWYPAVCLAGEYKVTRVIDGDTLIVQKGSTTLTIRLVGG